MKMLNRVLFVLAFLLMLGVLASSFSGGSADWPAENIQNRVKFVADTSSSRVYWACMKHEGFLKLKGGGLMMDGDSILGAHFSLDMKSIRDTDIDYELMQQTFENVLKSVVFFNANAFPQAQFELHEALHKGNNQYHLTGDFILFDIPMCYDFEGELILEGDSLHFQSAPFILNRIDWGIFYLSRNNLFPSEEETFIVSDSIQLKLDIKTVKG